MTPLLLGEFGTMLGERRPSSLGDRESLSRPCTVHYARVVALDHVSRNPELIQLFHPDHRWP
jgi:hypothetical protein